MADAVAEPKTLEQRITQRLHESIGDLITDEDLKAIVERGVESALFKGRQVEEPRSYGNGYETRNRPPLVDELVDRYLKTKMEEAITKWLSENPEQLQAAVDRAIQAGVADAVMNTLDNRFASIFSSGVSQMQNMGLLLRPGS